MSEENVEVATEPKAKKKVNGVSNDAALKVLVDSNPKRAGSASYDRFEGYLTDPKPTTVAEALENGLGIGDIHYDIIHGSIEVEGATVEEYMPTPRAAKEDTDNEGTDEVVDLEVSDDSDDSDDSDF